MSARLSPAANLLRNSKLFALPPAIALPTAPPSSNEISSSDTATTPFPRYAAIETTESCGKVGDWGFKRPLPLKTIRNTNNPVVRLVNGIDTAEHVADFESAADHVLTLRKFSELHQPIKLAETDTLSRVVNDLSKGAFRASSDNTTNLSSTAPHNSQATGLYGHANLASFQNELPAKIRNTLPEQQIEDQRLSTTSVQSKRDINRNRLPPSRWRYAGPSLRSITGEEFEAYLKGLGQKEKVLLHEQVREQIIRDKQTRARDEGEVQKSFKKEDITEEELQAAIRHLRAQPAIFGRLIAKVLDLPAVKPPREHSRSSDLWEYGTNTLASPAWAETGTPKTHPSAGLSYADGTHSVNHPRFGPQLINHPVVARAVKKKERQNNQGTDYGVAGFITASTAGSRVLGQKPFTKTDGGMKGAVVVKQATIGSEGNLLLKAEESLVFDVMDDKVVNKFEVQERRQAAEMLAQEGQRTRPAPQFSIEDAALRSAAISRLKNRKPEPEPVNLDAVLGRKR